MPKTKIARAFLHW